MTFNIYCKISRLSTLLILLSGCNSGGTTQNNYPRSKEIPIVRAHNYHILAMGDSITRGSNVGLGNYRRPLQALLFERGYQFEFVGANDEQSYNYFGDAPEQTFTPYQPKHEGYGGFLIKHIGCEKTRKDNGNVTYSGLSATLEASDPDIVLLMLGTNDIIHGLKHVKPSEKSGFSSKAAKRMDQLITRISQLAPGVALVVATIPPLRATDRQLQVEKYNPLLKKIIINHQRKGRKIMLADMEKALNKDDLTRDGVHPTTEGYNKMAWVWFAALTGGKKDEHSKAK